MGLRQTISEWVESIKEALDFGPEFPAAMEGRRVLFAQESARLQHLLEQTRQASQEKDELIAKLRTTGAVTGNMVVDGPAYYIRKANALDGPFCTSCFQRRHEIMRIAPAPRPKGTGETPADWVECGRCKAPFRSDRISQYLNPGKATGPDDRGQMTEDKRQTTELQSHPSPVLDRPPSHQEPEPALVQTAIAPEEDDAPKPIPAACKPRRNPKRSPSRLGGARVPNRDVSRLGSPPTGETETTEKVPQAPQVAMSRPTRTRKPKNQRPEQTKTADLPEST